jgi:predicted nuclease of restriction endonuclease-like RecB superfamily
LKNKFETTIYKQLRRARVNFDYESERIPYILARHYIPDFVIKTERGKIYIETKGYLRPEDKSKLIAVKKMHPGIDLRIIFYAKNKKSIKWAEKHGFIYAIERIPNEWLNMM